MQLSIFDSKTDFKFTKPIRLISLFSGYDSQLLALKYLGADVESWKTCEWAVKSIQALKDLHFGDDNTDYSKDLTKEQLIEFLYKKGISSNYNEPMTEQQIKRLGETKLRNIYNNIKSTHNMVNIQQVHGKDLEIKDVDKFEYLVTYSYPCQDLSLAGKQEGMKKGSGTRSGMLWEFERILDECSRGGGVFTNCMRNGKRPTSSRQEKFRRFQNVDKQTRIARLQKLLERFERKVLWYPTKPKSLFYD